MRWNGQPLKSVKPCLIKVKGSLKQDDFFKWWQQYDGKLMFAKEATTQDGQVFYMYDGDGSATRKMKAGGLPNMNHHSFEKNSIDEVLPVTQENLKKASFREPCKIHYWSTDEKPIFKTRTKYCLKCRQPKLIWDMQSDLR